MAAHGISNITKLDHHTKAKRMVMVHANQTIAASRNYGNC
jgi:hypothetical protein